MKTVKVKLMFVTGGDYNRKACYECGHEEAVEFEYSDWEDIAISDYSALLSAVRAYNKKSRFGENEIVVFRAPEKEELPKPMVLVKEWLVEETAKKEKAAKAAAKKRENAKKKEQAKELELLNQLKEKYDK